MFSLATLALGAAPARAFAHEGRPLAPHDLWGAWSLEPVVIAALAASLWLYVHGVRVLWRRAGVGHGVRRWEAAAFAAGWVTLALALVSPLHALGSVLFSAHMVQHELLMALAAPLLVLGRPLIPAVWALPRSWRGRAGRAVNTGPARAAWLAVSAPFAAWLLHAVALWLWHVPIWYQATLESELAHSLQHASFLVTALLFWWALLRGRGSRMRHGASVLYLFTTLLHTGALGALLAFSTTLWYPAYGATTGPWGLTPLEDQQLAGLIMWIPASLSYLVAALWLVTEWLREAERRVLRRERAGAMIPSMEGPR
jgi:putative membrane protein